jgi:hypothetical protein
MRRLMFDCLTPSFWTLLMLLSRTTCCQALVKAAVTQDKSTVLLETLMSSLLLSFSSYQVTSALGKSACSKILSKVSSLASNGYLGNSADSLQLLADIVSSFTVLSNATSLNNSILQTQYPVDQAVSVKTRPMRLHAGEYRIDRVSRGAYELFYFPSFFRSTAS